MKKGDLILVYGTLRKGERADLSSGFYSYGVDFIGPDRVNGRLYHLGAFPGVKGLSHDFAFHEDAPVVTGEVFRIRDQSIVALLDAYEGYRSEEPDRGLYDRQQAMTEIGRKVWVYTYNGMIHEDQRIASGDWVRNRDTITTTRKLRA
jgi:gamma-glutamylcyclotransferase (GGCT)/AIG2-like uncharacterized protein YtfP